MTKHDILRQIVLRLEESHPETMNWYGSLTNPDQHEQVLFLPKGTGVSFSDIKTHPHIRVWVFHEEGTRFTHLVYELCSKVWAKGEECETFHLEGKLAVNELNNPKLTDEMLDEVGGLLSEIYAFEKELSFGQRRRKTLEIV